MFWLAFLGCGDAPSAEVRAARERMRRDRLAHGDQEIAEVEELWQVANRHHGEVAPVAALEKLLREHHDVNRPGCAVLYLGQMSSGSERRELLTRALEEHAEDYDGDGVNVGAYAAYHLGMDQHRAGRHDAEAAWFAQIDAGHVDHDGGLLVERIAALHPAP